ncbi:MAG TPA: hypothetical protein G4O11_00295 [Anaerolineae bacterium]|nr:hypothetical protein [Anaerolineae bacterium]
MPGYPPVQPGPLARFLPPLKEGCVSRSLKTYGDAGELVLDPFGASPRLVVEAAQANRAVLVAANNPITRFILLHTIQPFTLAELQIALARLAAAPKDGSRLEPFILDLYRTECARCGASVLAESFIWERDSEGPTHKIYMCDRCNHTGEATATEADWERARVHSRRGLQHALALEQVAPTGDPDRRHAETALSVYPGRTLFALITLLNKLEQLTLPARIKAAGQALLLSAFDTVNALWGYPEGRSRPRQLIASPRYREDNVWWALERAVGIWAMEDPNLEWFECREGELPEPGTVAVFPGPMRDLVPTYQDAEVRFLLTVLPRPNQAFWTLSALWAAWLWGRAAAAPIKVALRRRRYDWAWHAGALRTVMAGLKPILNPKADVLAFMPEAEPGFMAAALAGFDSAGYRLEGRSLRLDEGSAVLRWSLADFLKQPQTQVEAQQRMASAAIKVLRVRGEPGSFSLLHAAAWCDLARDRLLAELWSVEDSHLLTTLSETFEAVLADPKTFVRLGQYVEPESGLYWLADPSQVNQPLADRVEMHVLEILRKEDGLSEVEIDERVCQLLPGILTPDRRLVQVCLQSYAVEDPTEGHWHLRSEDEPASREEDCQEIRRLLVELGERLGFAVQDEDVLIWLDEQGGLVYTFKVMETAAIGAGIEEKREVPLTYVLPGGRASLVAEKLRRDPRLREWIQDRVGVIKFRLVRRLMTEVGLTQENLAARLNIDPPEHHDPQLPLL